MDTPSYKNAATTFLQKNKNDKTEIIKFINKIQIDKKELINFFEREVEKIKILDEKSDVKMYRFFKLNYNDNLLFFDPFHPTNVFFMKYLDN